MKYLFLIEYIEVKDVKSCKDQEKLNQSKERSRKAQPI